MPKNLFKITAEEWKKSTSGWHASLKVKGESSFNTATSKLNLLLGLGEVLHDPLIHLTFFNLQQSFEGQELSSSWGNAPIVLILLDFFVLSSLGRSFFFHFLYHIQVIQEFLDPKVVPQKVSLKIMNPDLQGLQVKTNLSLFYCWVHSSVSLPWYC